MYGSIRKSYGAKASRDFEHVSRKKDIVKDTKKKEKKVKREDLQTTSYINVDDVKQSKKISDTKNQNKTDNTIKNEFPIASVILTIVFTMMFMVLVFGCGGV